MASSAPSRAAGRSFRNSGGGPPPQPPTNNAAAYLRRSSSGRYLNFSRDSNDLDGSGDLSTINVGYTVHIPPTPDNQPMGMAGFMGPGTGGGGATAGVDPAMIGMKAEQQMVSSSIFTGGFNSMTRSHVMDKITEGTSNHPQMGGAAHGSTCSIDGCDGHVIRNERGEELSPCECNFKICRDCYADACAAGGTCPGCKEPFKSSDNDDPHPNIPLSLPAPPEATMERRLSIMKSKNNHQILMRAQNNDFDHANWLYETKGTYGFGNALWPVEPDPYTGVGGGIANLPDFKDRARRPLSRKVKVPAGILSPYRYTTRAFCKPFL